jgi:signal transduction histidine kinase/CheY-like chemotaxis protein
MTLILGGLLSLASSLLLHRVLFARDQAEALAAEKTREALAREREATEARLVAREGEERLRKWESLGVMAAGIAHDFNNQLMVVQGGAEILQSRPLETLEHDYVRMIHSSAVKMAVLCRHMLVFAGQSGGAGRPLDWREVVGPHLQATARRLGVEGRVEFRCGDHLSRSVADHSQVSEIVDHLMANAVEAIATTDQGKIVVTIEERHVTPDSWRYIAASPEFAEGKAIVVSFADNGCGMDSPTLERAFDPFFSTKFLGRGLGLPAVAGFVRSMGGAVGIESRLGVGTVVTLMFPRVGRAASRGEEAVESVASRKSVLSKNGVVFLADDEDQVREVAHKMIERLGFDVLASGDFSSAREILDREARRLSVAVLDFRMEGGPHGTLVSYVRERFPALPVVLITGSRESEVIETLGTSQSWVYLSKPFSLEALQRSLDRALELGSSSRQRCPSDVK